MAKLKCRCGHKFAETLADLQQQGVARLKCPTCGQDSTIPASGNATQPVSNQNESAEISNASDVGDFFWLLSSESTPIPLTVTATPEVEPVEMPTTGPDAPSAPSWYDRAKAMLTKQVAVPMWLMLAIGVGVLTLVISLRGSVSVAEQKPDNYEVNGLEAVTDADEKFDAKMCIATIKSHIQLNADDPKSIQWVQFSRLNTNTDWVVWYRALNTHNAIELFKERIYFKTDDKTQKVAYFQIQFTERLPIKR